MMFNSKNSVLNALHIIYRNRGLAYSLGLREIRSKYRSSIFGELWAIIYPLINLSIYAFVFGYVFKNKWGLSGSGHEFIPMLYCGLIVQSIFAETVSKSSLLIVNNPNYVKKIIFPLEILPFGNLLSALFGALVNILILIIYCLIFGIHLSYNVILFPIILVPIILYAISFSWVFSAIGVFFRDIDQLVGLLLSGLLFLSPIFYDLNSLPIFAQNVLSLNPLCPVIIDMRSIFVKGGSINLFVWTINTIAASVIIYLSLNFFESCKPHFGDSV